MSVEPGQAPEPEVQPSSTPEGPQVIPTPATPEGEPGPNPDEVDNRTSNPNSGGPDGLAGDLGISSERTRPSDAGAGLGIEGTGTRGTALGRTDGQLDTSPADWGGTDVSQSELHPDRDDELDESTGAPNTGWRPDAEQNVDRTVGEPRPNPIPDEKLRRD
jgi:hypothetical protein